MRRRRRQANQRPGGRQRPCAGTCDLRSRDRCPCRARARLA